MARNFEDPIKSALVWDSSVIMTVLTRREVLYFLPNLTKQKRNRRKSTEVWWTLTMDIGR